MEHLADEARHVVVLGAVLRIGHQSVGQPRALLFGAARRARARQTHALHLAPALAHQKLRRAAAEEHVGVAVQKHRAARRAVDEVHQHVLRRERARGHQALPTRQHHLLHASLADGAKRRRHSLAPRLARVRLQPVGDAFAPTRRRAGRLAHEPLDAPRIHRPERVHLQKRSALALDQHDLGQHEAQTRERLEQLVGGSGIARVEAIEREEHRLMRLGTLKLAFRVVERRQRDAAAKPHEAHGTVLAVVDELVGEALLQRGERIHDVGIDGSRVREDFRHEAPVALVDRRHKLCLQDLTRNPQQVDECIAFYHGGFYNFILAIARAIRHSRGRPMGTRNTPLRKGKAHT